MRIVFVATALEAAGLDPGCRVVITDLAWTAGPEDPYPAIGLRDVVARVLTREELFSRSLALLDDWAGRSGISGILAVDGVSLWHRRRLGYWWWLHERLAWIAVLDDLLADGEIDEIEVRATEPGLALVARLVASARRLSHDATGDPMADAPGPDTEVSRPMADRRSAAARSPWMRLRALPARGRLALRRRAIDRRLARLVRTGPGGERPVAVLEAPDNRQLVVTTAGTRRLNPFLDPVVDHLAGTPLDPVVIELGTELDDAGWRLMTEPGGGRRLPAEILARRFSRAEDGPSSRQRATAIIDALDSVQTTLEVAGIDLGPSLVAEIRQTVRGQLPGRIRELERGRRLLRLLRPRAVVLVNEYGRSEWVGAARLEGIPSVAVQHGIIHRWHVGYRHASRSPELPLPDRTCVFGDYERRLLVDDGVYRPEEVVVTGSPRLDIELPAAAPDRAAVRALVRAELGIGAADRMLLVTTTSADVLRRFYVVPAIGALFDEPLPGVHVVVKLHPGEVDGQIYEQLFDGLAAARGGPPTKITVVQHVDLYRLLIAADAHLSSFSTVLTEAVAVGTPNLIAVTHASADLLGYLDARVALPVRNGADLAPALAAAIAGKITPDDRAAFVVDHYRPGLVAPRIREVIESLPVPT